MLHDFEDLTHFHDGKLIRGIYGYGFERPTPIQQKAILPIIEGKNILAQAQSGTGKTGAFVIGTLTRIEIDKVYPQAIILANTHELAQQIYHVTKSLAENMNIKISLCISNKNKDDANFDKNEYNEKLNEVLTSHILIGTTGKILSLSGRIKNMFDRLKIIVFDEADKLLDKNFYEQSNQILNKLDSSVQKCFFSATMQQEFITLIDSICDKKNYIKILLDKQNVQVISIKNYVINVERYNDKIDDLIEICTQVNLCQILVFTNSKRSADHLNNQLLKKGQTSEVIHAEITNRQEVIERFRTGKIRFLIATDILGRGIDVTQVGIVINYEMPFGYDEYMHRVGRSGRYGRHGIAINIVSNDSKDVEYLENIRKQYKIDFIDMPDIIELIEHLKNN